MTSTDYVGALLERGAERAAAERLDVEFQVADAEALPFDDASFDAVVSTFGVMFAPDHAKSAAEMAARLPPRRPHRPRQLDARRLHRPAVQDARPARAAAAGRAVAGAVGHRGAPARRCSARGASIDDRRTRTFNFRYRSAAHFIDVFRTWYGPVHKAFAALPAEQGAALERDLTELLERLNRAGPGSLVVPSEYLEVVVTRR